jgi:hypothetical protein
MLWFMSARKVSRLLRVLQVHLSRIIASSLDSFVTGLWRQPSASYRWSEALKNGCLTPMTLMLINALPV